MKPSPAYAPRGLRRTDAARYVGVSPTTFDEWVAAGRMPQPARVGRVVIYDRQAIDLALEALWGSVDQSDDWEGAFGDPETSVR